MGIILAEFLLSCLLTYYFKGFILVGLYYLIKTVFGSEEVGKEQVEN